MPAALILAGTRAEGDPVALREGVSAKALVEVGGSTSLDRVIDALRAAGISRIVVSSGAEPVRRAASAREVETIEPGAGPSESTRIALDLLGAPLLVVTADHPLLSPHWISHFLIEVPADADVATMLASRELVEKAIPGSRRTWLKFADGHWSGCNVFLLQTPAARRAVETWIKVEKDRKRPWRIARRVGPVTLVRYLLGTLSVGEAIARLGRKIGLNAAVVSAPDGLAALDVDSVEDLDMVRAVWNRNAGEAAV